jgi:hypothetical protein
MTVTMTHPTATAENILALVSPQCGTAQVRHLKFERMMRSPTSPRFEIYAKARRAALAAVAITGDRKMMEVRQGDWQGGC